MAFISPTAAQKSSVGHEGAVKEWPGSSKGGGGIGVFALVVGIGPVRVSVQFPADSTAAMPCTTPDFNWA